MKTSYDFRRLPAVLILAGLLVALPACDLANHETSLEEQDLDIAAAIISDALADQTEGLFADLHDMTAQVSRESISYNQPMFGRMHQHQFQHNRGAMQNFDAVYDPESGFHIVEYSRTVETPRFTKSVTALIKHRYTDLSGDYIEFPSLEHGDINVIEYDGVRAGETRMTQEARVSREQTFERAASWTLSGLLDGEGSVLLTGEQTHSGWHAVVRQNGSTQRDFTLRLWTDDAMVDLSAAEEVGLESAVTGSLHYVIHIEQTVNGEPRVRDLEGTIDLAGDGTAILRFQGLRTAYLIGLDSALFTNR